MSEEPDYEEILDQNVGEVKSSLRDLESPDWAKLLQMEKDGKDRKTVKSFVEDQMDEQADEVEEVEETSEGVDPYFDTEDAFLDSFSREQLVTGGVLLGVVLGALALLGASATGLAPSLTGSYQASPAEVQNSVQQLFTASGVSEENIEFVSTERSNGMYYMQLNLTQQSGNETVTNTRSFYVSSDGALLFPEIQSPMITTPIRISETLQQLEQRQQTNQTTQ